MQPKIQLISGIFLSPLKTRCQVYLMLYGVPGLSIFSLNLLFSKKRMNTRNPISWICLYARNRRNTKLSVIDQRADRGPRPRPGEAHPRQGPHGQRAAAPQRGLPPPPRHGHRRPRPAHARYGHLRHLLPGGVPPAVGRPRQDRPAHHPPADLRDSDDDLQGRLALDGADHVLREAEGDAALLRVHRVPVSGVQEPVRLLPWA